MSPLEIVAILAMTTWAVYKQTQVTPVHEKGRFKMAWIYGIVALCVGGFVQPSGAVAWTLIATSVVLSVVVGIARGRLTQVWVDSDGQVVRQGTVLTVSLFVGLILAKVGMGVFAYTDHVKSGGGFGEVVLMIAIMIAVQAEIVWRRARAMAPTQGVVESAEHATSR